MVIKPFAPYGLTQRPKTGQICHKLGPHFAERISLKLLAGSIPFEVLWNCLDLYLCNIMVIRPWPWIFKVKFWKCCISWMEGPFDMEWKGCESIGCYTHFFISTLTSTITLTLDFQGQILKKLYLRSGTADWHLMKGMWVDIMLDSHCDFKLLPHPWPWPWIFNAKYWNCCNSGMGGWTHLELKGCELDMMLDAQWDWPWATVHSK